MKRPASRARRRAARIWLASAAPTRDLVPVFGDAPASSNARAVRDRPCWRARINKSSLMEGARLRQTSTGAAPAASGAIIRRVPPLIPRSASWRHAPSHSATSSGSTAQMTGAARAEVQAARLLNSAMFWRRASGDSDAALRRSRAESEDVLR